MSLPAELGGSDSKESACNAGDLGLVPGLGRFPGERKGYPLQYSGLENPIDSMGPRSWVRLNDFHFTILEKTELKGICNLYIQCLTKKC